MDISAIANQAQAQQTASTSQNKSVKENQNLSSSDFLKLLLTQLSNQDPLNPMEDKEFMAQMAQFSSLEETTKLNTTMSSFVQQQQVQSASAYLGKEVSLMDENGEPVEGIVTAVNSRNAEGKVTVTVNDQDYDIKQVQSVRLGQ